MPTADDALAFMRANEGLGETPAGSNHNEISAWYGFDGPWCAMTISKALCHAGFTSTGDDVVVPGIRTTTAKGWAYVPYLLNDFRDAGRADDDPRPGDLVIFDWDHDGCADHVGMVERLEADGTFWSYEGNRNDVLEHVHRDRSVVLAFCHPPYDESPPPSFMPSMLARVAGVPSFPGYCSLGVTGAATKQVQARLAKRGWMLDVDGVFGAGTDTVVRKFQAEKGLAADGVVGPETWNAICTATVT